MLLVLVTGEPLGPIVQRRGDFAQLIQDAAHGAWSGPWEATDLRAEPELPSPRDVTALVVTGSPSSVTDREPWTLRGQDYLASAVAAGTPTFGICYGHQMLAEALGGRVEKNPRGREIGTVELELLEPDPLFEELGSGPLLVNQTHVDSVVEVPSGARVLARTALDPYAAIRFGAQAWGVQFHPEIDGDVMAHYVSGRMDLIASEGLDAEAIRRAVRDGVAGTEVLRRFLRTLG